MESERGIVCREEETAPRDLADKSTGRSGDNAPKSLDTDCGDYQPFLDGRDRMELLPGTGPGGVHRLPGLEFEQVLRGGDRCGCGRLPPVRRGHQGAIRILLYASALGGPVQRESRRHPISGIDSNPCAPVRSILPWTDSSKCRPPPARGGTRGAATNCQIVPTTQGLSIPR